MDAKVTKIPHLLAQLPSLFSTYLYLVFLQEMCFLFRQIKVRFLGRRGTPLKYLLILAGLLIISMDWVAYLYCGTQRHVPTLGKASQAWTGATPFSLEHKKKFRGENSFKYPPI